tara:strand:- start:1792 stop:2142 length:351 start_codon:yes stop_codon:yes gene_type:complete
MGEQLTRQEAERRVDWLSTLMHPAEALWYGNDAYYMAMRLSFRSAEAAVARRCGVPLGPLREFDAECREVVEALRLPGEFQVNAGEYHDGLLSCALGISAEWIEEWITGTGGESDE